MSDSLDRSEVIDALSVGQGAADDVWCRLDSPTCVPELKAETDIPIATLYRAVNALERAGLIELAHQANCTTSCRSVDHYVQTCQSITLRADNGAVDSESIDWKIRRELETYHDH